MKKIVFGITSLTIGGAEKVLVDIVNELKNKYDITILSIYDGGEFAKQVDKKVKIVNIFKRPYKNHSFIEKRVLSLLFSLELTRKFIYNKYLKDKYDRQIAFLEGPITTLFSLCPPDTSIAWIHNDIDLVFGNGIKAKIKKKINKTIYAKYKKLIFVSKDNLKKFNEIYHVSNQKKVIYNYINTANVLLKADEFVPDDMNESNDSFLVVARLVEQKGLIRLLKVHKHLLDDGFKHDIYVIGDGPLKDELNNKIKEYNVKNSFILLGRKDNPYPYIKKANVLLLPSLYEGYGMVIIEARILKKFILITDTAAREALNGYKNSMIVANNEKGIYEGMKNIIQRKENQVMDTPYDNKNIIDDIIELIES
jgi:glycosyltransferase involved in cell wall biosynthesis